MSPETVKTYLKRLYPKHEVASVQAVIAAYESELVRPGPDAPR